VTLRRILWPDGGFVLNDYVWHVDRPAGWMTFTKRAVFPVQDRDGAIATLYADREHTQRLGTARRGPHL
jgi:hypothetical protein